MLFLLFTNNLINAQYDFRDGYIVDNSSDTIYGKVNYIEEVSNNSNCIFKNNSKKNFSYSPDNIKAFGFINGRYFISKIINGEQVFLEYLVKGKLSVYYLKDSIREHYFLENENIGITEYLIEYKQRDKQYYKSLRQIGTALILKDAPELQTKLSTVENYTPKKIIKIAMAYNNKIDKGNPSVICNKNFGKLNMNFEVSFGEINYNEIGEMFESNEFSDVNYNHFRLLFHIGMLRTNKRLYCRTGLVYSIIKFDIGNEKLLKIPIQFEYLYPLGFFTPKFAIGISVFFPFYFSNSYMVGCDLKIYKSFYWNIDIDYDFFTIELLPVFPRKLLSYSISTGFQVKL